MDAVNTYEWSLFSLLYYCNRFYLSEALFTSVYQNFHFIFTFNHKHEGLASTSYSTRTGASSYRRHRNLA